MDEVRRVFRFTLPGMASAAQLLIGLAVSHSSKIEGALGTASEAALGSIVAVFLGSGALGYVFANVYFAAYWWKPVARYWAIDHKSMLVSLGDSVKIVSADGTPRDASSLSLRDAWTIVTCYWHSHIGPHDDAKELNRYTDRLADVTHSLGASTVGSVAALLAWLLLQLDGSGTGLGFWAIAIIVMAWLGVISAFILSHRKSNAALQSIANSTMRERIASTPPSKSPVKIWYVT